MQPLKGRDLFVVSVVVAVFMAIVTVVVLLLADRDAAAIFGVLTALQLVVVGYGYCDMRKEKAQKLKQQQQQAPKN
jgi:L-asparagine transporter-like permease